MIVSDAMLAVSNFGTFGALAPGATVQKEADRPEGWLVGPGGRWHIPNPEVAMQVTGTDWTGFQALVRVVPPGTLANVPIVSSMQQALGAPQPQAQVSTQSSAPSVQGSSSPTGAIVGPFIGPAAPQAQSSTQAPLWTSPVFWGGLMLMGGGAYWYIRKRRKAA